MIVTSAAAGSEDLHWLNKIHGLSLSCLYTVGYHEGQLMNSDYPSNSSLLSSEMTDNPYSFWLIGRDNPSAIFTPAPGFILHRLALY